MRSILCVVVCFAMIGSARRVQTSSAEFGQEWESENMIQFPKGEITDAELGLLKLKHAMLDLSNLKEMAVGLSHPEGRSELVKMMAKPMRGPSFERSSARASSPRMPGETTTLLTHALAIASATRLTRHDVIRALSSASSAAAAAAVLTPLAAVADRGKDLYESDRSLLSGGGELNSDYALPEYDEEGKIIDAKGTDLTTTTRALEQGKASVQILKQWVQAADGAWADPVTGNAASALVMTSQPSSYSSITDAGKPERLEIVSALRLASELKRADTVAIAVRKQDGVTYYDYDLALPATRCNAEMASVCLPSKVVLLSCCVREGALHVLRIEAMADDWRRAGRSLKELRSTFAVAGDA